MTNRRLGNYFSFDVNVNHHPMPGLLIGVASFTLDRLLAECVRYARRQSIGISPFGTASSVVRGNRRVAPSVGLDRAAPSSSN